MNDRGPRYAVYFVPAADSGLYRFGSGVLQYDCYAGGAVPPPREFDADRDMWRNDTAEPRVYGFHATMKPPFHLAPSCTEAGLVGAFEGFARGRGTATISPAVRALGGFIALVPDPPNAAVDALAADCTTAFDGFRAPMSADERARRLTSGLSESQIGNLDRWGYPYVFSEFRFHMTLTGRLADEWRDAALAVLRAVFARMCGEDVVVLDRLALMKQEAAGSPFRVLAQARLQAAG